MADVDLFVIGGGSGGVACARRAASYGAKVAIAEASRLGGTCVIRGCIPKKLMSFAGHMAEAPHLAQGYGFTGTFQFDFTRLLEARNAEIARLEGIYDSMLDKSGVRRFSAMAALAVERAGDELVVEVAGERVLAARVLVATGGRPSAPEGLPGRELAVTSDEILEGTYPFPRRLVVIGAGYIGIEQASIFNALGSETTLILRSDLPLRGFEDDLRRELATQMTLRGITILSERMVRAIRRDDDGLVVETDQGSVAADAVLLATGRSPRPNTSGIGLEAHGVKLDSGGAICVNGEYESSTHGIYAVGDCSDHGGAELSGAQFDLTPVAIAEGRAVADRLYAGRHRHVVYETIPTAVFGLPQAASVGHSEAGARAAGHDVAIFHTNFRPLLHTMTGLHYRTMMKIVVDRATDRVLGVHMVGDDAGEIIQGFAVALTAGVTKRQLDDTVALHPTAAEELVTMYQPVG